MFYPDHHRNGTSRPVPKSPGIALVRSLGELGILSGHTDCVSCVALSSDARAIVSGSAESAIVWETSSGRIKQRFAEHDAPVTAVAFAADNETIASGSADGTVIIWLHVDELSSNAALRMRTQRRSNIIHRIAGAHKRAGFTSAAVLSLAFSLDMRALASGGADQVIRLWNAVTGQPTRINRSVSNDAGEEEPVPLAGENQNALTVPAARGPVGTLFFSRSDSNHLVACQGDGTVARFDITTGRVLSSLRIPSPANNVAILTVSPHCEDRLVSVCREEGGHAKIWNVAALRVGVFASASSSNPQQQQQQQPLANATLIHPSEADEQFQTELQRHHLPFIPVEEAQHQHESAAAAFNAVAFSPGPFDLFAASCSVTNAVSVWNGRSACPLTPPLTGHDDEVTALAVSSDGRTVVSASRDKTLRVWQLKSFSDIAAAYDPASNAHNHLHHHQRHNHHDVDYTRSSGSGSSAAAATSIRMYGDVYHGASIGGGGGSAARDVSVASGNSNRHHHSRSSSPASAAASALHPPHSHHHPSSHFVPLPVRPDSELPEIFPVARQRKKRVSFPNVKLSDFPPGGGGDPRETWGTANSLDAGGDADDVNSRRQASRSWRPNIVDGAGNNNDTSSSRPLLLEATEDERARRWEREEESRIASVLRAQRQREAAADLDRQVEEERVRQREQDEARRIQKIQDDAEREERMKLEYEHALEQQTGREKERELRSKVEQEQMQAFLEMNLSYQNTSDGIKGALATQKRERWALDKMELSARECMEESFLLLLRRIQRQEHDEIKQRLQLREEMVARRHVGESELDALRLVLRREQMRRQQVLMLQHESSNRRTIEESALFDFRRLQAMQMKQQDVIDKAEQEQRAQQQRMQRQKQQLEHAKRQRQELEGVEERTRAGEIRKGEHGIFLRLLFQEKLLRDMFLAREAELKRRSAAMAAATCAADQQRVVDDARRREVQRREFAEEARSQREKNVNRIVQAAASAGKRAEEAEARHMALVAAKKYALEHETDESKLRQIVADEAEAAWMAAQLRQEQQAAAIAAQDAVASVRQADEVEEQLARWMALDIRNLDHAAARRRLVESDAEQRTRQEQAEHSARQSLMATERREEQSAHLRQKLRFQIVELVGASTINNIRDHGNSSSLGGGGQERRRRHEIIAEEAAALVELQHSEAEELRVKNDNLRDQRRRERDEIHAKMLLRQQLEGQQVTMIELEIVRRRAAEDDESKQRSALLAAASESVALTEKKLLAQQQEQQQQQQEQQRTAELAAREKEQLLAMQRQRQQLARSELEQKQHAARLSIKADEDMASDGFGKILARSLATMRATVEAAAALRSTEQREKEARLTIDSERELAMGVVRQAERGSKSDAVARQEEEEKRAETKKKQAETRDDESYPAAPEATPASTTSSNNAELPSLPPPPAAAQVEMATGTSSDPAAAAPAVSAAAPHSASSQTAAADPPSAISDPAPSSAVHDSNKDEIVPENCNSLETVNPAAVSTAPASIAAATTATTLTTTSVSAGEQEQQPVQAKSDASAPTAAPTDPATASNVASSPSASTAAPASISAAFPANASTASDETAVAPPLITAPPATEEAVSSSPAAAATKSTTASTAASDASPSTPENLNSNDNKKINILKSADVDDDDDDAEKRRLREQIEALQERVTVLSLLTDGQRRDLMLFLELQRSLERQLQEQAAESAFSICDAEEAAARDAMFRTMMMVVAEHRAKSFGSTTTNSATLTASENAVVAVGSKSMTTTTRVETATVETATQSISPFNNNVSTNTTQAISNLAPDAAATKIQRMVRSKFARDELYERQAEKAAVAAGAVAVAQKAADEIQMRRAEQQQRVADEEISRKQKAEREKQHELQIQQKQDEESKSLQQRKQQKDEEDARINATAQRQQLHELFVEHLHRVEKEQRDMLELEQRMMVGSLASASLGSALSREMAQHDDAVADAAAASSLPAAASPTHHQAQPATLPNSPSNQNNNSSQQDDDDDDEDDDDDQQPDHSTLGASATMSLIDGHLTPATLEKLLQLHDQDQKNNQNGSPTGRSAGGASTATAGTSIIDIQGLIRRYCRARGHLARCVACQMRLKHEIEKRELKKQVQQQRGVDARRKAQLQVERAQQLEAKQQELFERELVAVGLKEAEKSPKFKPGHIAPTVKERIRHHREEFALSERERVKEEKKKRRRMMAAALAVADVNNNINNTASSNSALASSASPKHVSFSQQQQLQQQQKKDDVVSSTSTNNVAAATSASSSSLAVEERLSFRGNDPTRRNRFQPQATIDSTTTEDAAAFLKSGGSGSSAGPTPVKSDNTNNNIISAINSDANKDSALNLSNHNDNNVEVFDSGNFEPRPLQPAPTASTAGRSKREKSQDAASETTKSNNVQRSGNRQQEQQFPPTALNASLVAAAYSGNGDLLMDEHELWALALAPGERRRKCNRGSNIVISDPPRQQTTRSVSPQARPMQVRSSSTPHGLSPVISSPTPAPHPRAKKKNNNNNTPSRFTPPPANRLPVVAPGAAVSTPARMLRTQQQLDALVARNFAAVPRNPISTQLAPPVPKPVSRRGGGASVGGGKHRAAVAAAAFSSYAPTPDFSHVRSRIDTSPPAVLRASSISRRRLSMNDDDEQQQQQKQLLQQHGDRTSASPQTAAKAYVNHQARHLIEEHRKERERKRLAEQQHELQLQTSEAEAALFRQQQQRLEARERLYQPRARSQSESPPPPAGHQSGRYAAGNPFLVLRPDTQHIHIDIGAEQGLAHDIFLNLGAPPAAAVSSRGAVAAAAATASTLPHSHHHHHGDGESSTVSASATALAAIHDHPFIVTAARSAHRYGGSEPQQQQNHLHHRGSPGGAFAGVPSPESSRTQRSGLATLATTASNGIMMVGSESYSGSLVLRTRELLLRRAMPPTTSGDRTTTSTILSGSTTGSPGATLTATTTTPQVMGSDVNRGDGRRGDSDEHSLERQSVATSNKRGSVSERANAGDMYMRRPSLHARSPFQILPQQE